jgi:hypothetical protein
MFAATRSTLGRSPNRGQHEVARAKRLPGESAKGQEFAVFPFRALATAGDCQHQATCENPPTGSSARSRRKSVGPCVWVRRARTSTSSRPTARSSARSSSVATASARLCQKPAVSEEVLRAGSKCAPVFGPAVVRSEGLCRSAAPGSPARRVRTRRAARCARSRAHRQASPGAAIPRRSRRRHRLPLRPRLRCRRCSCSHRS